MIQVQDISFSFASEFLYEGASFSLPKNKKAGLVGLNGAGKSTLFKLLLQEEWPEEGTVRVEGTVRLVPQEVSVDPIQARATNVLEYLESSRKHKPHVYLDYFDKMELKNVALTDSLQTLSGGQKTKLALLHAVLSEPDVLLLDEPTNFMDIAGKKWVMHWLSTYKKTLLVVSHDLDLLDKHIHKVVYINKQTKKFEEYTGTYSKFLKLKADRDRHLTKFIKNQQKKIDRMKKSVEQLKRSNAEKKVRQRVQLEKRIERIQDVLPELPQELVNIKLHLPQPAHIGELPILIKEVSKQYGELRVLKNVSFSVKKGQRVALIGHNGAGKSTLIKIMLGMSKEDSGRVNIDDMAKIGYYSQEFVNLDLEQTLFDMVREKAYMSEGQVRAFLSRFMFNDDKIWQRVSSLSGGEKTRLAIALLMVENYNLLILDEPTTYLDVLSQKIMLEALKEYQGTMVVVSHTPEFLIGLQPDHALLLPEEKYVYWDNTLAKRAAEL